MTGESFISLWTWGYIIKRQLDIISPQKDNYSSICDHPSHGFLVRLLVSGMKSSLCGLALKSNYKAIGNLCNTMPLLYHEQSCQADHCFGYQGSQVRETVDGFFPSSAHEEASGTMKVSDYEEKFQVSTSLISLCSLTTLLLILLSYCSYFSWHYIVCSLLLSLGYFSPLL